MDKILIIDSNSTDRKFLRNILSNADGSYNINDVGDSSQAFEVINQEPPDLILLGCRLRDTKEFEILKQLKEQTKSVIPILLVSFFEQEIDKIRGLESGATDIINKPVIPQEVKVRVAVQLKMKSIVEDARWIERETNKGIKILYKELEKKTEAIKKLDALKTEFVSTVSHELRTPLTMMKEFSAIILDEIPGKLNNNQREYMQIICNNIERLTRLIDDLLNISKIEAGEVKLKKKIVNIADLASDVFSTIKVQANEKHIQLQPIFHNPSLEIWGDADKIVEVFTNLLDNAIKFSPENENVMIEIKEKEREVECSVTNVGEGIAPEHLEKIFDRFHQIGRTVGAGTKGTGLGLAISKELVEMHQGRIWAESDVGKEARFIFTLPKGNSSEVVVRGRTDGENRGEDNR